MKTITAEEEDNLRMGITESPILTKKEAKASRSAVCLKKYPKGFVLEISCDSERLHRLFFDENYEVIYAKYQNYSTTIHEKGNPFLDNGMSKEELKLVAAQLGKPEGEIGIRVGQMMNETNGLMIRNTIKKLSFRQNEYILELGHGNANHLSELHQSADNLTYLGLDISTCMKEEAEAYISKNGLHSHSSFSLYDGTNIPFPADTFDKIFTVNTLYFWEQPVTLLTELNRVVKPDGMIVITLVEEETMQKLPFTEYGFTRYNREKLQGLIAQSPLKLLDIACCSEMIKSEMLGEMERKYWIVTLKKGV